MVDREQRNIIAGAFQPRTGPRNSYLHCRLSLNSYASLGLAFSQPEASIPTANSVASPGTGSRGMLQSRRYTFSPDVKACLEQSHQAIRSSQWYRVLPRSKRKTEIALPNDLYISESPDHLIPGDHRSIQNLGRGDDCGIVDGILGRKFPH